MTHGPFDDWHAAMKHAIKHRLLITNHHWDKGKLYVNMVPYPEKSFTQMK